MKAKFLSIFCFCLLSACAHAPPPVGGAEGLQVLNMAEMPAPEGATGRYSEAVYKIGAYDKLLIDVFGVDDFNREVQVDGSGKFSYPLVGQVQASGLTLDQLANKIADSLRGRYVRDPQVTVNLKESVSSVMTVDGQVNKPGLYPILGPTTLIRAVAAAGGTSEFAKLQDVVVFRNVGTQRYVALYNLEAIRRGNYGDPRIFANDVIVVGDSPGRRRFRDLMSGSTLLATPLVALINTL